MKLKYMNMDEKNYWALIALYKCLKVSHVDCIDSIQDMVNMFGNEFNLYSKCSFLLVTSDVRKSIVDLSNKYHFCYHLSYLTYEKIEEMLPELNELNTLRIALTGGEPTIHPDFIKIAILFLKHGFDLTILTNGYNYDIIEKLLQSTQKYHYMIKVSLDGIYAKHDEIRGREGTFQNVVRSLKTIQKNKNVVCMISTVEMRQNESSISEIMKYIQENFPEMKHTIDFAFPDGNAVKSKCAFSIEEIKTMIKEKKEESVLYNINNGRPLSKYRCSGGISQCTITSKGDLKICTAANQPQFIFKYNAFQKGIAYAWCHCGKNIKRYRKEKVHQTKDCKKCKYKSKCGITDCRMLALVYNGDEKRSSPLTCAIAQNIVKNTEGQA